MAWRTNLADLIADVLRLLARAALLFALIVLSVGACVLITKLVYFFVRYCNRTIFGEPW